MVAGVPYRYLIGLVLAHLFFAIAAAYYKQYYLIDSYGYLLQADNLVNHNAWYAEDWNMPILVDYFSIRPPFYAAFIAVCKWIHSSVWVLLFCQACLSIFNSILAYRFLLKQGVSFAQMPQVALALLMLYPAQLIHSYFVMSEICFQTALILLFISTTQLLQKPTFTKAVHLFLLLAGILWIKPVAIVLTVVCLLLLVVKWLRERFHLKLFLPFLFVVFSYHLICRHHQQVTGYYHYTSIGSINHLKYNARYTLIRAKGEQYADSTLAAIMNIANSKWNYQERLDWMNAQANKIIIAYPIDFMVVYGKGCVSFLVDPGRFDLYHFANIQTEGPGLMHEMQTSGWSAIPTYLNKAPIFIIGWLLLALLTNTAVLLLLIIGFSQISRQPNQHNSWLLVALFFIGGIMLATGPVGVSRYKVPLYPIITMVALFGYAQVSNRKKKQHAV
jgi:hypothetical protein